MKAKSERTLKKSQFLIKQFIYLHSKPNPCNLNSKYKYRESTQKRHRHEVDCYKEEQI